MAVEGCKVEERSMKRAALCMRQPARRLAGSLSSALATSAIIVAGYELFISSVYNGNDNRFYYGMRGLLITAAQVAFVAALGNAALIFAFLRKNFVILETVVCAAMAMQLLCIPVSLSVILGLAYNQEWVFMLWEVPRLVWYPFHVSLMFCLLEEVRGNTGAEKSAAAPPDGWLKNNLSRQGHSPITADELVLKVHGGNNNTNNTNAPATFTPSSCLTAAPVHLAGNTAHINPSGPLSSSDA